MTDHPRTARQLLTDYGLSEGVVDGILDIHAHQLAEQIRQDRDEADIPGSPATPDIIRGMTIAADRIDPEVQR